MPAGVLFPVLSVAPACAGDPELFFPPSVREVAQIAAAKRVCGGCSARRECLAFALTHAVHGVWGGTTEAERAALQREHGLPRRVAWSGAPASDTHDDSNPPSTDSTSEA